MFEGLTVALVTPFRDGRLDVPAIEDLVEWHVEQGTDMLLPCGTTGESPTLSHEEHDLVVDTVIKAAAGRVKVLAGAGSNSTSERRSAPRLGPWPARPAMRLWPTSWSRFSFRSYTMAIFW